MTSLIGDVSALLSRFQVVEDAKSSRDTILDVTAKIERPFILIGRS